jgi:hypothetical protein
MSELLQTVIPVVLPALIAGQVAITRTGRLRKDIRETIDLLGKLPTDHPNRATLEAHEESCLVRRQQRRYEPFTQAGVSLGPSPAWPPLAFVFACGSALLAIGVLPSSSPSNPQTSGTNGPRRCSSWPWRLLRRGRGQVARRQLWEHPTLAQPSEAA